MLHVTALMKMKGIVVHRDGFVNEKNFEEAWKHGDKSFVAISTA
jgi:hypothetical protein